MGGGGGGGMRLQQMCIVAGVMHIAAAATEIST